MLTEFFNQAISAGAAAIMDVMDMFWGDQDRQIMDPHGHIWSVTTHKQDLSQEEIQRAEEAAFKEMMSSPSSSSTTTTKAQ
jgi:PhnB protein